MKIRVTQADIAASDRHTATSQTCPVARAIQRETGRVASVEYFTARVGSWTIPLPHIAIRRVAEWDITGEMTPFEFTLDL